MIAEKNTLPADDTRQCALTRTALGLTDRDAVSALLGSVLAGHRKALVTTEGLVVYATDTDVAALSSTLLRPEFSWWCLGLQRRRSRRTRDRGHRHDPAYYDRAGPGLATADVAMSADRPPD